MPQNGLEWGLIVGAAALLIMSRPIAEARGALYHWSEDQIRNASTVGPRIALLLAVAYVFVRLYA
jgi:hypothetical protein